jgi:hypothetical protein
MTKKQAIARFVQETIRPMTVAKIQEYFGVSNATAWRGLNQHMCVRRYKVVDNTDPAFPMVYFPPSWSMQQVAGYIKARQQHDWAFSKLSLEVLS